MNINKCIDKDNRPTKVEQGKWVDAKNILINNGYKSARCEQGTALTYDNEFEVIGSIGLDKGFIAFEQGNSRR